MGKVLKIAFREFEMFRDRFCKFIIHFINNSFFFANGTYDITDEY